MRSTLSSRVALWDTYLFIFCSFRLSALTLLPLNWNWLITTGLTRSCPGDRFYSISFRKASLQPGHARRLTFQGVNSNSLFFLHKTLRAQLFSLRPLIQASCPRGWRPSLRRKSAIAVKPPPSRLSSIGALLDCNKVHSFEPMDLSPWRPFVALWPTCRTPTTISTGPTSGVLARWLSSKDLSLHCFSRVQNFTDELLPPPMAAMFPI